VLALAAAAHSKFFPFLPPSTSDTPSAETRLGINAQNNTQTCSMSLKI
jgi:hypothetical protein